MIGVRRTTGNKPSEPYKSEYVSGNYFSTFGIPPYLGRNITPEDDRKGAPPVAMMSFRTWQQKFGQDPSVVGGGFVINGQPFTVIGLLRRGFSAIACRVLRPSFFLPLNVEPLLSPTGTILEEASLDCLT